MESWVKDLCEDCGFVEPFKIGDTVKHPDGYMVRIIDGQYWGDHGLSNFWYWRRVDANGTQSEKVEHGYGWKP